MKSQQKLFIAFEDKLHLKKRQKPQKEVKYITCTI